MYCFKFFRQGSEQMAAVMAAGQLHRLGILQVVAAQQAAGYGPLDCREMRQLSHPPQNFCRGDSRAAGEDRGAVDVDLAGEDAQVIHNRFPALQLIEGQGP